MLDFIPFVGSIKGAFEAFTGEDLITGKTLSASDRWAAGIGSVLGALPIPGAKQGGKYLTKGTIELEEQLEKSLVSAGTSKYRLPMDLQLFAGKGKNWNKISGDELKKIGTQANQKDIRAIMGTADDAFKFFKAQVTEYKEVSKGVFVGKDANGVIFTFRASSKSGPPTIDINGVKGLRKIKFLEE
ncbi:pre-toxin TG domain-containing protein [Paenibacillus larvae]|uniref:pre-toxin TG domain-containing protein n=1 Tax=Paenibacillus larvae TaxID=1464 RepID=UPI00235059F0|nr:pre-toxin TG domain-containing protein [Paenibacillus larvae]